MNDCNNKTFLKHTGQAWKKTFSWKSGQFGIFVNAASELKRIRWKEKIAVRSKSTENWLLYICNNQIQSLSPIHGKSY